MTALFDLAKPLFWYLAVIAAVVYGLHLNRQNGYDEGYSLAKSQSDASIALLKKDFGEAAKVAANAALSNLRIEQGKANKLAGQLTDTKETLRQITDRLTGDIARVTKLYRRALATQLEALPVAVFTNDFVRVWNTANGVAASSDMPPPNGPGRIAAIASKPGTVDDLDSGVTQEQLLTNHVRNGELYAICRAQLTALINWTRNESK